MNRAAKRGTAKAGQQMPLRAAPLAYTGEEDCLQRTVQLGSANATVLLHLSDQSKALILPIALDELAGLMQ